MRLTALGVMVALGALACGGAKKTDQAQAAQPAMGQTTATAPAVPTGPVVEVKMTGNHFVGIGLGSSLTLGALAGLPPAAFADIDPDPDGVRILGNQVTGNGGASPIPFLPAVDLLWDGRGTRDCWQGNTFGTSAPAPLPACR